MYRAFQKKTYLFEIIFERPHILFFILLLGRRRLLLLQYALPDLRRDPQEDGEGDEIGEGGEHTVLKLEVLEQLILGTLLDELKAEGLKIDVVAPQSAHDFA